METHWGHSKFYVATTLQGFFFFPLLLHSWQWGMLSWRWVEVDDLPRSVSKRQTKCYTCGLYADKCERLGLLADTRQLIAVCCTVIGSFTVAYLNIQSYSFRCTARTLKPDTSVLQQSRSYRRWLLPYLSWQRLLISILFFISIFISYDGSWKNTVFLCLLYLRPSPDFIFPHDTAV